MGCEAEAVRQKLCSSILMMMSFHVEFLCLLLVLLGTAGAGKTIQNEDSTLPAVNFKFEFPVKDGEAGGQRAHDIEDAALFNNRAQHLLDAIERDSKVFAAFAATAHDELDGVASLFGKM